MQRARQPERLEHAGFGPAGPGGIYVNGAVYVDLNAVPGFSGAGTDPHPALTVANGGDWFHDPASLNLVGRVSFGDLDITEDGTTLPGLRTPIRFSDAELALGRAAPTLPSS